MTDVTTVYLAGPVTGDTEQDEKLFRPACEALAEAGYRVVAPAWQRTCPASVETLLSGVEADLAMLAAASCVVTLPGSETIFEPVFAASVGVPVVPLAVFLPDEVLLAA